MSAPGARAAGEGAVLGYERHSAGRPREIVLIGLTSVAMVLWAGEGVIRDACEDWEWVLGWLVGRVSSGVWRTSKMWPWQWGPVHLTAKAGGPFKLAFPWWYMLPEALLESAEVAALVGLLALGVMTALGSRRAVRMHLWYAAAWVVLTAGVTLASELRWESELGWAGTTYGYELWGMKTDGSLPLHKLVTMACGWWYPALVTAVVWSPAVRAYLGGGGAAPGRQIGGHSSGR